MLHVHKVIHSLGKLYEDGHGVKTVAWNMKEKKSCAAHQMADGSRILYMIHIMYVVMYVPGMSCF